MGRGQELLQTLACGIEDTGWPEASKATVVGGGLRPRATGPPGEPQTHTGGRESQRHAHRKSQEEAMPARKPSCQKPRDVVKCSVMETRGASSSIQERGGWQSTGCCRATVGVGGSVPPLPGGPALLMFSRVISANYMEVGG